MTTYIFIDGSYYCFYRYFSLVTWWKLAHKDEPLGSPCENEIFINKFKQIFVKSVGKILKNITEIRNTTLATNTSLATNTTPNIKIIVGKDCRRSDIWRCQLYPEYKANRENNNDIKYFFELAYDELYSQSNIDKIINHPKLEADDCIAIYSKYLLETEPDCNIYIITSDNDYLQLAENEPRINIYNLAFKNLKEQKSAKNCNLFCKILMGDLSDNIPGIIQKCGIKTAMKYNDNIESFNMLLNDNNEIREKYELNRTLMDFNCIPENLINEFKENNF